MALVQFDFESAYLNSNTHVWMILPDRPHETDATEFYESGQRYPVLWLLHGTYGDASDWVRKTKIELYAAERNLIVVMPDALNSNYANWEKFSLGYNMFDFLPKELMPLVWNWFPASRARKDNFVAGLSMGGRGASVYAFNYPELFAGMASLSAAPRETAWVRENDARLWKRTEGCIENAGGLEAYEASYENTWRILDELTEQKKELPKLYFTCGTKDPLIDLFRHFSAHADEKGIKAHFEEITGYAHEWRFWDLTIEKALDYFGLPVVN